MLKHEDEKEAKQAIATNSPTPTDLDVKPKIRMKVRGRLGACHFFF
jgi:hypothetical protein